VIATDDGSWERAQARMSRAERRTYRDVPVQGLRHGTQVQRLNAVRAVARYVGDLLAQN